MEFRKFVVKGTDEQVEKVKKFCKNINLKTVYIERELLPSSNRNVIKQFNNEDLAYLITAIKYNPNFENSADIERWLDAAYDENSPIWEDVISF